MAVVARIPVFIWVHVGKVVVKDPIRVSIKVPTLVLRIDFELFSSLFACFSIEKYRLCILVLRLLGLTSGSLRNIVKVRR